MDIKKDLDFFLIFLTVELCYDTIVLIVGFLNEYFIWIKI